MFVGCQQDRGGMDLASTSISRFFDWFVDTLTDAEIDQLVSSVTVAGKSIDPTARRKRPSQRTSPPSLPADWKTKFTPKQKRDTAAMMWKGGVRGFSEYFYEKYAECKEKTDSYTLDEIDQAKEALINTYGGPAVVLCLVLQHLDYKQEAGLRIMDELGGTCKPPDSRAAGHVVTDLVSHLRRIAAELRSGKADVCEDAMETALLDLAEAWSEYRRTEIEGVMRQIESALESLGEPYQHYLSFFGVDPGLPMRIDPYERLETEDARAVLAELEAVADKVNEANEARQLLSQPGAGMDELEEALVAAKAAQAEIASATERVIALLSKPPKPPEDPKSEVRSAPGPKPESESKSESGSGAETDADGPGGDKNPTGETIQPSPRAEPGARPEPASAQAEPPVKQATLEPQSRDIKTTMREALARNDYAAAHWLAREAEASGKAASTLPSWLYGACSLGTGAHAMNPYVLRALDSIYTQHSAPMSEIRGERRAGEGHASYYVIAASIGSALFSPDYAALEWLRDVDRHLGINDKALSSLLKEVLALRSRATTAVTLGITAAGDGVSATDWAEMARTAAQDIADWVRVGVTARSRFRAATRAQNYFAGSDSSLWPAINVAMRDDRNRVDVVSSVLDTQLSSRKAMDALIDEAVTTTAAAGAKRIVLEGRARDDVLKKLQKLSELLTDWRTAVVSITAYQGTDRSGESAAAWLQLISKLIVEARAEMPQDGSAPAALSTVLEIVGRSIDHGEWLQLTAGSGSQSSAWKRELVRPLMLIPDPPAELIYEWIDDGGFALPGFESTRSGERGFLGSVDPPAASIEDAVHLHIARSDFPSARLAMSYVPVGDDDSVIANLKAVYDACVDKATGEALARAAKARSRLEQSTLMHFVNDAARSRLEGELLTAEELLSRSKHRADSAGNVGEISIRIHTVLDELDTLKGKRAESLAGQVDQFEAQLDAGERSLSQDVAMAARQRLESARRKLLEGDLVLADHHLTAAEQVVDLGKSFDFEGSKRLDGPHIVEFCGCVNDIERYLRDYRGQPEDLVGEILSVPNPVGLNMKRVPGKRIEQARAGLEAYYYLKGKRRAMREPWFPRTLQQLLEYVGFGKPKATLVSYESDCSYFKAVMDGEGMSPLADFGSDRNGRYDVVLVYNRPSITHMRQILSRFGLETARPIIIYMGRMVPVQRQEWSAACRDERLTAMFIDELLLVFLASVRENRLAAAVECGVAWGWAMPYKSAGKIPPEIFMGRKQMIRDIGEPRGSSIVFGGRQFGKTALLHMVVREYHRPQRDSFAWVEDIKTVGVPEDPMGTPAVWQRICDRLAEFDLFPKARPGSKGNPLSPATISSRMEKLLADNQAMRILVLLDEADQFLESEKQGDFKELGRIRALMEKTDYRFKAVFCGLKDVQRYYTEVNHPFAQLSRPVQVGTLEPLAAEALIREPMESMGIFFDSGDEHNDTVTRILSYTNYHPALIQLFCAELAQRVRRRSDEPPYICTMQDVEDVYLTQSFRNEMRNRFEWTIGLDPRYQVIVYAMILEQLDESDGYRKRFTASEIGELAEAYWPKAFRNVGIGDIRPLLDELINLGVLIRTEDGLYRLRSANVVRALGSPADIMSGLEGIVSKPPPSDDASSMRRVETGRRPTRWGTLTLMQARELARPASGITLVFGSNAMSITGVRPALGAFLKPAMAAGPELFSLSETTARCMSAVDVVAHINRETSRPVIGRHIVFSSSSRMMLNAQSMAETLDTVGARLQRFTRGRRQVAKWVLLLYPDALEQWFLMPEEAKAGIEQHVLSEVRLAKWNREMIAHCLGCEDLMNTAHTVNRVYEATGGWPYLMSQFMERALAWQKETQNPDASGLGAEFEENLLNSDSRMGDAFIAATGMDNVTCGREITRLVAELGPMRLDDLHSARDLEEYPSLAELSGSAVDAAATALEACGVFDGQGTVGDPLMILTCDPIVAKVVLRS